MDELAYLSLTQVADLIRSGDTSSEEVTRAILARIEEHQPKLNCFIRLDAEAALARARRLDQQRPGDKLGALHGVPMAHKDVYYRAGKVSTCGSRIRKDFQPQVTSTLLSRLDEAGAVDLGTLNMTEFAFGPTGHNAIWGNCRNPWSSEHISGGSSSGSGAAVAAGLAYASLGSDSGGSVRLPASMCGVVGLKPTLTRLSLFGAMGLSFSIDTPGTLSRTVRDCARMMNVIAGHDPLDPYSSTRAVPDYEAAIGQAIDGLRVGVPSNYFYDHCNDEIKTILQNALSIFENLGAKLVDVAIPDPDHLMELSRAVLYPEGSALHSQWLKNRPEDYSPQIRVRAATGYGIPAPVYLEAVHARPQILQKFVVAVFSACDILYTPVLSFPVPTLAETDVGSTTTMWEVIGLLCHATAPINYLGLPAMSVPAGFTENGLPSSFQLVGPPFAESTLLKFAAAYETVTNWSAKSLARNSGSE